MDLRERVVAAAEEGVMSHEEIADTFQVSVSWIGKLLKRFRETGPVAPEPHRGGQPGAFQGEAAERLVQAFEDNPDATLKQLALIARVSCSTSATDRMLRRLGITRKKVDTCFRTGPARRQSQTSCLARRTEGRRSSTPGISGRKQRQYVHDATLWPVATRAASECGGTAWRLENADVDCRDQGWWRIRLCRHR